MIVAAADGSSLANPGPSGWAWYIDDSHWAAGGWAKGTNNMGELMSVLSLLQATREVDQPLRIVCDSQYAINCCTRWMPAWKKRGWRKADNKPVLNVDLLKQLDAELAGRKVTFQWVKGHAGHPLNEKADELARAAATAYQQGTPLAVGPGYSKAPVALAPNDDAAVGVPGAVSAEGMPDAAMSAEAMSAEAMPTGAVPTVSMLAGVMSAESVSAMSAAARAGSAPVEDEAYESALVPLPPDPLQRQQPDLFSIPYTVRNEPPETSLVVDLTELTRELLSDETQLDRDRLGQLMHPEYVAHLPAGIIRTKGSIMARPAVLNGPVHLDVLGADRLAKDVTLLRYKVKRNSQDYLCAVIWQRADTDWQARFQQITPVT